MWRTQRDDIGQGFSARQVVVSNPDMGPRLAVDRIPRICAPFTDVEMPGRMDGLELAVAARRLRPDLCILIASGKRTPFQDDLPERAVFLSKPYQIPMVTLALAALLAEAAQFQEGRR